MKLKDILSYVPEFARNNRGLMRLFGLLTIASLACGGSNLAGANEAVLDQDRSVQVNVSVGPYAQTASEVVFGLKPNVNNLSKEPATIQFVVNDTHIVESIFDSGVTYDEFLTTPELLETEAERVFKSVQVNWLLNGKTIPCELTEETTEERITKSKFTCFPQ